MDYAIVGIDISKATFDVGLLDESDKTIHEVFDNNKQGFEKFLKWLQKHCQGDVHACMEATGIYGEKLAEFLYRKNILVSVVNPLCIKSYGRSLLVRTKTDVQDAAIIARYCKYNKPVAWKPPPPEVKKLRDYHDCLQTLKDEKQRIQNRLETMETKDKVVKNLWKKKLDNVKSEIKIVENEIKNHINQHPNLKSKLELLISIPCVSHTTAVAFLAMIPDISQYKNARQLAAHIGLTPCQRQSGTSVRGKTRMSKIGNSKLRKALYMPAVVGKRCNPLIMQLCKRLEQAKKPTMQIIGAAMRMLAHIMFGVLKTGKQFNAQHA